MFFLFFIVNKKVNIHFNLWLFLVMMFFYVVKIKENHSILIKKYILVPICMCSNVHTGVFSRKLKINIKLFIFK